jgi:23S rRNA (uracil1939-C5)-methyltransferase
MSRRSRKKLPQTPVTVEIEKLSHEGRGIAHIDGKTVFVHRALPHETVILRYSAQHRRFDEGDTEDVLKASPLRVAPVCPHFGFCGGCQMQHMDSDAQIQFKQTVLLEQLQHLGGVQPAEILPPLTGNTVAYRHKARLGVRYVIKKQQTLIGFRERRSHFIADIDQCPILHPSMGQALPALKTLLTQLAGRDQIAQIEVAVGDNHTALVLRNMNALSAADEQQLIDFAKQSGLHFYLQPAGADSVYPLWPVPALPLVYTLEPDLRLQFAPLDFTQVNPAMNRKMLAQALALLRLEPQDAVLELFCGLGNFTLPLAKTVRQVTAVEGDAGLIVRAKRNAADNGLDNIDYHVANLMETPLAAPWLSAHYDKILLDPPRSGALEIIEQLDLSQCQRLLYIACNPATLARDAGILVKNKGLRLVKAGVMDMFPHTAHVESMALFIR